MGSTDEPNAWAPGYISPVDGKMWDGVGWIAAPQWGTGEFADKVWDGTHWVTPTRTERASRQLVEAADPSASAGADSVIVGLLREQVRLTRSIRGWVMFLGIVTIVSLAAGVLVVLNGVQSASGR